METVPENYPKQATIYLMQRVPNGCLDYAHIQQLQAHLQVLLRDVGMLGPWTRWVHGTRHVLHGFQDSAKVRLS